MTHDHDDSHPHVKYWVIFALLCVCTAISCAFDLIPDLPKALIVSGVLAVAVAKATFVMMYFMHLKFEGMWKFVILAPTAILAVGLMVALAPDMAMHYYTYKVPQTNSVSTAKGHGGGHGESDSDGEHPETEHSSEPTPAH